MQQLTHPTALLFITISIQLLSYCVTAVCLLKLWWQLDEVGRGTLMSEADIANCRTYALLRTWLYCSTIVCSAVSTVAIYVLGSTFLLYTSGGLGVTSALLISFTAVRLSNQEATYVIARN